MSDLILDDRQRFFHLKSYYQIPDPEVKENR